MKKLKHTPGPWTVESDGTTIALLTALTWITRCARAAGPSGTTMYFISDAAMADAHAAIAKAGGGEFTPVTNPIVVTVQGGAAQGVENVPPGVTVEVHDYDLQGDEETGIETDADGNRYRLDTYAGDGAGTERSLYACPDCGSAAAAPAGVVCRVCKRGIIERKGR